MKNIYRFLALVTALSLGAFAYAGDKQADKACCKEKADKAACCAEAKECKDAKDSKECKEAKDAACCKEGAKAEKKAEKK